MSRSDHIRLFILLLSGALYAFLIPACYTPPEGCTDINAVNYDAVADDSCCCTYPRLVLSAEHKYGDQVFKTDSVYLADDGHKFRLKSVVFYLSDFALVKDGNELTVSDTISLKGYGPTEKDTVTRNYRKDYLLLRRTNLENAVGSFRETGTFQGVSVRLGLNPDLQKVIPALAPAGTPLEIQSDSLWHGYDKGYVFLQIVAVKNEDPATQPDTISFTYSDIGDFFIHEKPGVQFLHEAGYDFPIRLSADYKALLKGIDWTTGDISQWKSRILSNLDTAFYVY